MTQIKGGNKKNNRKSIGLNYPIVISEFGGNYQTREDQEFQQQLLKLITGKQGNGGFYWAINPWGNNDIGGYLTKDWKGIDEERRNLLIPLFEKKEN